MKPTNCDVSELAALLADAEPTSVSHDAVLAMLETVGIGPPIATDVATEIVARHTAAAEDGEHDSFGVAWDAAMAGVGWRAKDILRQQASPEQESRLREHAEIALEGHGSVCIEEFTRAGTERPLLWLWFKEGDEAKCPRYEWYQYVFIDLHVDNALRSYDIPEDDRTERIVTGLDATLAVWNPDYHVAQNLAAEAAQGAPNPTFKPDGGGFNNPSVPSAKPFHKTHLHVPGRPLGLVDAPNWCRREPKPNGKITPSVLDRLWRKLPERSPQQHVGPPPGGSEVVELRFEFRTYLVCLPDEECIGYLLWKYRNTTTIDFGWELVPDQPPPTLGITSGPPPRLWQPRATASTCRFTLEVGDWHPC